MGDPYQILTTPDFDRDFKKLDRAIAKRVTNKIEWLAHHLEVLTHPLQGVPSHLAGLQKYRIGDFRLLLRPFCAVGHRREVYRDLP